MCILCLFVCVLVIGKAGQCRQAAGFEEGESHCVVADLKHRILDEVGFLQEEKGEVILDE